MIIHLNGWPGVGKQTIGRAVAARLGARFIHNHLLHDVAIACAGIEDAARWPLYDAVREAAYAALVERPLAETLVMTNGLCRGSVREEEAWRHIVELALARRASLVPVVLEAAPDELARRLQSSDRQGRKLTDVAALQAMIRQDVLQRPDVAELLCLDVTTMSPADAAGAIVAHLDRLRASGALQPATLGHLALRR